MKPAFGNRLVKIQQRSFLGKEAEASLKQSIAAAFTAERCLGFLGKEAEASLKLTDDSDATSCMQCVSSAKKPRPH